MPSPSVPRPLDLPSRDSGDESHSGTQPTPTNTAATPTTSSQKRKRGEGDGEKIPSTRRKTACQSCRNRKVKCDNIRPACGFCQSTGVECVYIESADDKLVLDPATKLMVNRLDQILKGVEGISTQFSFLQCGPATGIQGLPSALTIDHSQHDATHEPSKDYLHVPACSGNADSILTWPVFNHEFPPDSLIGVYFKPSDRFGHTGMNGEHSGSNPYFSALDPVPDVYAVPGGLQPLPDERIPALIDRFLMNVHTKNPLLDVDALVRWGRAAAEHGLGWDAPSCLVLLACALGSVSFPFAEPTTADTFGGGIYSPGASRMADAKSTVLYASELRQAESCFVLACRRLGLLKYGVIGAQCHFYAGVYLMYTLRPLPSWNHFWQASHLFQLYLKTVSGPYVDDPTSPDAMRLSGMDRTQRRLEQSLYWSCFKSEVEFRVELPMPQSAIAEFEYPAMFPSPPSPPPLNSTSEQAFSFLPWQYASPHGSETRDPRTSDSMLSQPDEGWDIRRHNRKICNEEQSWYYYLTEVALRRISNRIKNTFYQQEPRAWMNVTELIPIAMEFEAQIATWSASLPPAMQLYEKPASPEVAVVGTPTEGQSSASKELSWATGNRLLEMKSWLYQPFLYYAIHRPNLSIGVHLSPEQELALQNLVAAGIECNIKTLEDRSLHHRHHGIWYDVRALVAATLTLIAVAKSGLTIPGGLFGEGDALEGSSVPPTTNGLRMNRFSRPLEAMWFWEDEAPDIKRSRKLLERLLDGMR